MTERMGVSADDRALADAVARYAEEALAPRAQALDEEGLCATCHVPGLAALGVMGMNIPEHHGGPGSRPRPCCCRWSKYPAPAPPPHR